MGLYLIETFPVGPLACNCAILADPTMQFNGEAKHDAALRHAIENREGSMGGTGVSGGGCGCN